MKGRIVPSRKGAAVSVFLFRLGLITNISSFAVPCLAKQKEVLKKQNFSVLDIAKDNQKISAKNNNIKENKEFSHSSINTITVTGTRLGQTRLSNVMAGSTLDAEQINNRGYDNLGLALLRENPAFSPSANSQIGTQGSYGAGQTFVTLFNLGSQRTLTLINGMRMVGGATASIFGAGSGSQVDVGTIPTSLVKKIDTKFGGAGAAYGADAVAGVVNYQLDDHFKGITFKAQGNFTQRLKVPQEKIYLKGGKDFNEGRGGVVFDVEYRRSGGVIANDRANIFGSERTSYVHRPVGNTTPYTYVLGKNVRYIQSSVTGMPLTTAKLGSYPTSYSRVAAGIASGNGHQAA
ncbi:TonB-dependent receptor plug domain-containing protein, partial [Zymomonas mobilis]